MSQHINCSVVGIQQPDDTFYQDGLAAPGFAEYHEVFTVEQVQGDFPQYFLAVKSLAQICNFYDPLVL